MSYTKKVLIGGLFCTLFLTGCGEKTLTCTRTDDELGASTSTEIKFVYDKEGKEIKNASFSANVEVKEEYIDYIDELEEQLKGEFEDIESFADVNVNTDGNIISVDVEYSTKGLSDDEKDELQYAGVYDESTYEETKSYFEEEGYTCK